MSDKLPDCAFCGRPIEPPFVPLPNPGTGFVDGTRAVHQHCWQLYLATPSQGADAK